MSFDHLDLVTVLGQVLTLDEQPAGGKVTFDTTVQLVDLTTGQAIFPVPLTVTLDGDGTFTIDLPATDDPDLAPTGWTYQVNVDVVGSKRRSFPLSVPHGTGPLELFLAAPVATSPGVYITRGPEGPEGPAGPAGPAWATGDIPPENPAVGNVWIDPGGVSASANYQTVAAAAAQSATYAPPPNPRGNWVTATGYAMGDTAVTTGTNYECRIPHTSGTFATDLAAGKWAELGVAHASAVALPTDAAGWLHDDGSGALAWSTPPAPSSSAVVGAFSGTPTGSKFLRDDGALAVPAGGGGGGGIIAAVEYSGAGSVYQLNVPVSQPGSLTAIDSTHLAITFTPTTTAIICTFTGLWVMQDNQSTISIGLLNASGGATMGKPRTLFYGSTNNPIYFSYPLRFRVTGLTIGTAYTFNLAWAITFSSKTSGTNAVKLDATSTTADTSLLIVESAV